MSLSVPRPERPARPALPARPARLADPPQGVLAPPGSSTPVLPPRPVLPSASPDALQQLLRVSTGWHVVPASVSWLVAGVAWAAVLLDYAVVGFLAWHPLPFDFLADIATLGGRSALVAGVGGVAAAVMTAVAVRTGGFRRANRAWFRVWTVGFVLSALTVAPLVAATIAGAVVVGLVACAALSVVAVLFAMLGGM